MLDKWLTDPAVSRLIHVALHFARILHEVVDSTVTQSRQVWRRKYCLYTTHRHTHTIHHNTLSLTELTGLAWEILPVHCTHTQTHTHTPFITILTLTHSPHYWLSSHNLYWHKTARSRDVLLSKVIKKLNLTWQKANIHQSHKNIITQNKHTNKLAPYGTDGRLLLTANFSHVA